jgi:hypothetical protein
MKEIIKQVFSYLGIGIIAFYMMMVFNIQFDRNKRYVTKSRKDLNDGWVTSSNNKLPEDYSPKKYKVRVQQSDETVMVQYKLIK